MAAGFIIVKNDFPRIAGGLEARAKAVAIRAAEAAASRARELAPVRTGRLRGSLAVSEAVSISTEVEVSTDVLYAGYQEFGTSKMAPHPYLAPAFEAEAPRFEAEAEAVFGVR